jgi:hypothetical protein
MNRRANDLTRFVLAGSNVEMVRFLLSAGANPNFEATTVCISRFVSVVVALVLINPARRLPC